MPTTCTVSGVLYDATGDTLLTGAVLTFQRTDGLQNVEGRAVAPVFGVSQAGVTTVTTHASTAAFSVDLAPGNYQISYQGVTGVERRRLIVPAASTADFENLLETATPPDSTVIANFTGHMASTANPHGVTAAQVGLGSVDNTSDSNKPISNAAQVALNAKAPLASPALTGTPTAPTATFDTQTTQLATTEFTHDVVAQRVELTEAQPHGAPIVGDLVADGSGGYAISAAVEYTGSDDRLGSIFDRLPASHGAPTRQPLVKSGDAYFREAVFAPDQEIFASGGEAWVSGEAGGWPLTDGSAEGVINVVWASSNPVLTLARTVGHTGYPAGPMLDRFNINELSWSFGPNIRRVVAIFYHGQSQAVTQTHQVITDTAVSAGRAAMFVGGPQLSMVARAGVETDESITPPDRLRGLADLVEGETIAYESPMSALASNILPHLPADTGILAINVAVGGQPIEDLDVGSASWHNLALALGLGRLMCEARGVAFEVGGLFWSQGGSNSGDSAATYAGKFTDGIYDPWDALMQAHGFAAHSVPVFVNGMTHNTGNDMNVARAALLLHDDATRNIWAVGPEYPYWSVHDQGIGDGSDAYTVHISAAGVWHRAHFEGRAYKAIVIDGGEWHPLRMVSAVRSGTTVTVALNIGEANIATPIVANSDAIAAVANAGFEWLDAGDGNSVSITGVAVNGSNQIELTLSDTPTGTDPRIGYALGSTAVIANYQGPINGARGSVADGASGTITVDGSDYSTRVHLHTDIINVTT